MRRTSLKGVGAQSGFGSSHYKAAGAVHETRRRTALSSMTNYQSVPSTLPALIISPIWTTGAQTVSRLSAADTRHSPVLPKADSLMLPSQQLSRGKLTWTFEEEWATVADADALCSLSYSEVDDEGVFAPPELGGAMDTLCILSFEDE